MQNVLRITIRFINPEPTFHGQRDGGEPEWPPSPLRLFQALVDAAASRWRERQFDIYAQPSMVWLEYLGQPEIVAPAQVVGTPFRIAVPNNDLDVWAGPISKGNEPKKQPNELKTMKQIRPLHLRGEAVHYLYALPADSGVWRDFVDVLIAAARSITHLGWGIDMAVGDADIITEEQAAQLSGYRWRPSPAGGKPLRVPKPGTLNDLMRKHSDFLDRLSNDGFRPVPPFRVFDVIRYRRQDQPLQRPFRVFELRNLDGSRFRYPHRKLIHIAGMVRHLAIEAMKIALPRGVDKDWVETYVAGHVKDKSQDHCQLSYLPLPSLGQEHTDPGVRRVMIAAPAGDEMWLDHVAHRLAGQTLKPVQGDTFGCDHAGNPNEPPLLVPVRNDNVARYYTRPKSVWHSFTPVILPGHDDHKSEKTRALIERALLQSGIDQPCEFDWSAISRFRKSYSAHKYDKNKQLQGYIRPQYLLSQTAVHLTIHFGEREDPNDEKSRWIPSAIPGPLAIGAGRHCGFGLMAAVD